MTTQNQFPCECGLCDNIIESSEGAWLQERFYFPSAWCCKECAEREPITE